MSDQKRTRDKNVRQTKNERLIKDERETKNKSVIKKGMRNIKTYA